MSAFGFDPRGKEPPEPYERTWQPVDLSAVLDGSYKPPQPIVGCRDDGCGLFYPGRTHTVVSESEGGKTWLALAASLDEIRTEGQVVYVDFEDSAGGIVGRLLAMQADPAVIAERFHYLQPTQPLGTGVHRDDLLAVISEHSPSLVILDGITEALVLHGLDPLSNKDVAEFNAALPRLLAAHGAAVVSLDHVTKDREGRGRYALGAVHKLNAVDGAAYVLENRTPFGLGLTGRTTVKLAKDRPGALRANGQPSSGGLYWFADLVVTSHDEAWVEIGLEPPEGRNDAFRPTVLMERVAAALAEHGPLSQRRIRAAVTGKNAHISTALRCLILDGFVSDSRPHELLKPYPEESF